ncbi:MAG: NAD-dependent epimerase/dehydratase family protein [Luteibaculaceae bacterium]
MSKNLTCLVAGATGLIGTSLVDMLEDNPDVAKIWLITRRPTNRKNKKITEFVIDFDKIDRTTLPADVDISFCCLGTTIKKAKTREEFIKVDFGYTVAFAQLAKLYKSKQFHLVSAIGSNNKSMFFYNRVKGMTEKHITDMKFSGTYIYRPSVLAGIRKEKRPLEKLGEFLAYPLGKINPNWYPVKDDELANSMVKHALVDKPGFYLVNSAQIRKGTPMNLR